MFRETKTELNFTFNEANVNNILIDNEKVLINESTEEEDEEYLFDEEDIETNVKKNDEVEKNDDEVNKKEIEIIKEDIVAVDSVAAVVLVTPILPVTPFSSVEPEAPIDSLDAIAPVAPLETPFPSIKPKAINSLAPIAPESLPVTRIAPEPETIDSVSLEVEYYIDLVTAVEFFKEKELVGSLSVGKYNINELKKNGIENDSITYIKVPVGYKVIIYQHGHFSGCQRLILNNTDLKNEKMKNKNWSKQISSIEIFEFNGNLEEYKEILKNIENWKNENGLLFLKRIQDFANNLNEKGVNGICQFNKAIDCQKNHLITFLNEKLKEQDIVLENLKKQDIINNEDSELKNNIIDVVLNINNDKKYLVGILNNLKELIKRGIPISKESIEGIENKIKILKDVLKNGLYRLYNLNDMLM